MQFTAEQQQTIVSTNAHLLVSAAAGSGKTAVMVERIVHLLNHHGLHIDKMLIVTFTKAAASELRQRLETRLMQCSNENPALRQEIERLQNAQISTIHSYCTNVIKRHFQYCQIDPMFQMANTRQRETLLETAFSATLDALYENAQEGSNEDILIKTFDQNTIADMMSSLFTFALSRPSPCAWIENQKTNAIKEEDFAQSAIADVLCKEAILSLQNAQEVLKMQAEKANDPHFIPVYLKTIQSDGELFDTLQAESRHGLLKLNEAIKTAKFARMGSKKNLTPDETRCKEWYKESRDLLKDVIKKIKALLPDDFSVSIAEMNTMLPCMHALCDQVIHLYQSFSELKREENVLDFNDLEHLAHEVLLHEPLRLRESELFDAIFVDEYQDVSALQEAILNALKKDDQHPYYFYVGDVKQSIYRFRQADPTLFLRKLQTYQTNEDAPERKIILNQNFRSRTSVLSAVNRVFGLTMDARVTEIDYDDQSALYPGIPTVIDPIPELHIIDKTGKKSTEIPALEADIIARDILKTIGTPTYDAQGEVNGTLRFKDIAILMPKVKKNAQIVEDILQKHGIPVYNESQSDAYASDEVVQLYQFLTLLDNLQNDIAMVSVLRSPLFEMGEIQLATIRNHAPSKNISYVMAVKQYATDGADDALRAHCGRIFDVLGHERFLLESMSLSDYLWHFVQDSGLYAHYGAQPGGKHRQANLRMICHQAMEYEAYAIDGLHGFLSTISEDDKIADSSSPATINPWEDVVRILTIHKSKGLEFPTVYVMGMGDRLTPITETSAISVDDTLGVAIRYQNATLRTQRNTIHQKAIKLRKASQDQSERLRLLYVALTRPKNRLVMIGSATKKRYDYEMARDLMHQAQPLRKNLLLIQGATTYLDWLIDSVWHGDTLLSSDQIDSTIPQWIEYGKEYFSTQSTHFPQKTTPWRVFFHNSIKTASFSTSKKSKSMPLLPMLTASLETLKEDALPMHLPLSTNQTVDVDPLVPFLSKAQHPLKLGVSALVASMKTPPIVTQEEDTTETISQKRLPMPSIVTKLIASVAEKPDFLTPADDSIGMTIGTYTHQLLSTMPLDSLKNANGDPTAIQNILTECVNHQAKIGKIDPSLIKQVRLAPVMQFLQSDLGKRLLASEVVKREYAFTLRIFDPFDTIVQGVIDLCFLENDQWVLLDFKTDHQTDPQTLLDRYQKQLRFYQEALQTLTPYAVKTCGLYALSLGKWLPLSDE